MSMLDCALRYATRWPVFPCRPGAKVPACEHGFQDATRDTEQIRAWWEANPAANIGVPTGEISDTYVLDVDGEDGMDDLVALGHGIPGTLTQATPSGGLHLVFRYPAEVGNSAKKLGGNLDTRGDGGYIVVAPSIVNGRTYRWTNRCAPEPTPGWLLRMVRTVTPPPGPSRQPETRNLDGYVRKAVEGEHQAVATAMQGARNHTLNASAFNLGTLVGAGALDSETVYDVLMAAARQAGLSDRESRRTIASGLTAGTQSPRRDVA